MKTIPVHGQGSTRSCTILVVDEDEAMRAVLVEALQEKGCQVVESHDGKGALDTLQTVVPQVIVTDLKIPDGGYPYLRLLKASAPQSAIVVMTAHGDSHSKVKALECGAKGYFEKPLHLSDLKGWIAQVCLVNPCGNIL
ncbi:MAG: response regulator [Nitrospirota bacterium]|nr:response regulator [Nitrospirota bacterium]